MQITCKTRRKGGCAAVVTHPFPAKPLQEKPLAQAVSGAAGPRSNTDQKVGSGALIDYLTVVLSETLMEDRGVTGIELLLYNLFGFRGEVVATELRNRNWQYYPKSAALLDREGEMVGKIGVGGNRNTVCVSLSGAGTRWVKDWARVQRAVGDLGGRITRCDLAFDDYEGKIFDVHDMRERAARKEFMQGGTPPKWRFLDDGGNDTGCTLYVGTKGHKELCIYEKGKQLKHIGSKWVRAEVRLYAKHGIVSLDVLTDPLAFLRGAYDVLELLLADVARDACTRIKTQRKTVEATGEALVRYMRRQIGPSLNLLFEAFGGSAEDFIRDRILREGSPGRFRGVAKGEQLQQLLREELCQRAA
jgi:phage replication initiation protein